MLAWPVCLPWSQDHEPAGIHVSRSYSARPECGGSGPVVETGANLILLSAQKYLAAPTAGIGDTG